MAKRPETALYFTSVVAIEKDLAVVGGHLYVEADEPTVTRLMLCSGQSWQHLGDMDDVVHAAERKPGGKANPRGTLCLLGRQGLYREIISGRPPVDSRIDIRDAGYLMDIRYIGNHLYACGGQNQIHKQIGSHWRKMDEGLFKSISGTVDRSLEAIDGFSDNDIYAVGSHGAIWHWNGKRWSQLDSPTNYPLYCVRCASSGEVYVGGSKGLMFRGRRDRGWTEISDPNVTEEVLEDLTEFQGKIYAAGTDILVASDGGTLRSIDVPIKGKKAFSAMDATADVLWCVGDEAAIRFDGTQWEKFVCPENR
jgi:hypothetical protein